ncbi:TKL protein kinase [Phytophthora cinnamomi]|uniref:TKL protein kinase n=1 Tax=Phytophthora cinnamomi TaxID=4785 RepID=UPI00355AA027|nr:TKL protein kinase [Phytophthora cinnamomi]
MTGFGISREQLDRTMTAGVGPLRWMAPEVMLGEINDDKADVFSFGVLLSELDMHSLQYAFVKMKGLAVSCCRDTAILQKVAMGILAVEFSSSGPSSIAMAELGEACVSVNPNERPSEAEALYKLQASGVSSGGLVGSAIHVT